MQVAKLSKLQGQMVIKAKLLFFLFICVKDQRVEDNLAKSVVETVRCKHAVLFEEI